jgi:hypothetical protein
MGAGLLVALVVLAAVFVGGARRVALDRWRALAAGLDGKLEIIRRSLWRHSYRVLAEGSGSRLLVAHDFARHRSSMTRLVVPAPDLGLARLVLASEADLVWSTQLELAETHVGDEVFVARFKLVRDAPARVRLWRDRDVRRALRVLHGWRLLVDAREIVLEHEDRPPRLESVRAAIAAALVLADSENRWRQRWHDVAPFVDARRASHEPPRLEVLRDGILVAIEPVFAGDRGHVRVRAELAQAQAAPEQQLPGVEPEREALERAVAEVAAAAQRVTRGIYR